MPNPDPTAALRWFGLGRPVEPPAAVAEAWSNEVFRVRTDRGRFAVKLCPTPLDPGRRRVLEAAIAFEQRALAAGIAAPAPVPDRDGRLLAELPGEAGPRVARCHRWVSGTPASRAEPTAAVAAAAGEVLGRLHALGVPGGDTRDLPGPDLDRWDRATVRSAAADLPWAATMAAIRPLLTELADRIRELRERRRPMRISHRDFDPKNAVLDPTGRLVLTDWDYAGPVLPGVELVTAAASFARTDDQLAEFAAAYRAAGGDAEPAGASELAVEPADLDWILRNVEAVLRDGLGPGSVAFETAAELIDGFADEPAELVRWADRLRGAS